MDKKVVYGLMVGVPIVGAIAAKLLVPDGEMITWIWVVGVLVLVIGAIGLGIELIGDDETESKEEVKDEQS